MRELINFYLLKVTKKRFTCSKNFGATEIFDKASLKLAINFLLGNCFINFGNLPIRLIIGIHIVF